MEIIKVLIVDEQDFFSEMLRRTLAAEPGMEVVGVAHDVILSAHKEQEYITSLPLDKSSGWFYLLKQSVR